MASKHSLNNTSVLLNCAISEREAFLPLFCCREEELAGSNCCSTTELLSFKVVIYLALLFCIFSPMGMILLVGLVVVGVVGDWELIGGSEVLC